MADGTSDDDLSGSEQRSESASESGSSGAPSDEFVALFTQYQRRLFLFILSQTGNPAESEEILQDANVVLLRKHHRFELGTNFYAWACRIATYEILKSRDRYKRDRLVFSEAFMTQIADDMVERSEEDERRRVALAECLQKLRANDRKLIQQRYAAGSSGKGLAERLGRPANSVYQSLGRIRRTLLECIERTLAREEVGLEDLTGETAG